MSESAGTSGDSPLLLGLSSLRRRALSAHASGDGYSANHICRVAVERLQRLRAPETISPNLLTEVRWVFSIWLHYFLDHELIWDLQSNRSPYSVLIDRLAVRQQGSPDHVLYSSLFLSLEQPTDRFSADKLMSLPRSWVESRSIAEEDSLAISLAIELCWLGDPSSDVWRILIDHFLSSAPEASFLASTLQTLRSRLESQSSLYTGVGEGSAMPIPPSGREDEATLTACWLSFLDCDWPKLDTAIQSLTKATRVEGAEYIPLFSLIHFSRFYRPGGDSQLLSLSRRLYGLSKQPGQMYQEYRSSRFLKNSLKLATGQDRNDDANQRWRSFVIAVHGQLAALRAWDFGRWVEAIGQHADSFLEVARSGDVNAAREGIARAAMSMRSLKRGSDPRLDAALSLVDRVDQKSLSDFVRWLLRRHPVGWQGVHRVLSDLSDAIPNELLPAVAQWTQSLTGKGTALYGWSVSYIGYWSRIIPFAENPSEVVESIRTLVLRDARSPAGWAVSSDTIIASIVAGSTETAREIIDSMIATDPISDKFDRLRRWQILLSAGLERSEVFDWYTDWLLTQPDCTPIDGELIRRVQDGVGPQETRDNSVIRDWMRSALIEHCSMVQAPSCPIPAMLPFNPAAVRLLTWPHAETSLLELLVTTIESPAIPLMQKPILIETLALLAHGADDDSVGVIAASAIRWLSEGVPGRILSSTDPTGRVQVQLGESAAASSAHLLLLECLLQRRPEVILDQIVEWIVPNALYVDTTLADRLFSLLVRIGMGPSSEGMACLGLSECIAERAAVSDPANCIEAFRYFLEPADGTSSLLAGAEDRVRTFLLRAWESRLVSLSTSVQARTRIAVASTLRSWEHLSKLDSKVSFPPALQSIKQTLASDNRGCIRWALR